MGIDVKNFSMGPVDSIFYIPSFISTSEQEYLIRQVNNAPASKWTTLRNRRLQNWGGKVHEKGLIAQPLPPWLASLTQRICTETGLFPSPINHVLVNEYNPGQGIMPHQDGPLYFPTVAILSLGSPVVMKFLPHQNLVDHKGEVDGRIDENPQPCQPDKGKDLSHDVKFINCEANHYGMTQKQDERSATRCQPNEAPENVSLVLLPGSLLIFKDAVYSDYLHGIEETAEHKLDSMVVNANALANNAENSTEMIPADENDKHTLRRTGARLSLTCRLVSRVQGKFLRL